MQTYLPGTLDRVERGNAVILLEDGQELLVPKELLQPLPEIGAAVSVKVLPAAEAEQERTELAATLLNQVLGNHEHKG